MKDDDGDKKQKQKQPHLDDDYDVASNGKL